MWELVEIRLQLIMYAIGEKLTSRAQRSHTLQDLHKLQGKLSRIPRNASVHSAPFKPIIKSDADYACQNSILKAKYHQRQLKAMIGSINRQTICLINSIRPKKQQKQQPKKHFISDRELQNSNTKILSLQSEIDSLEKQSRILSIQKSRKELPLMIEIIKEQKQKLRAKISDLKRVIERNGRQLLRRNETVGQRTELFGLYQQRRAFQSKKVKLIEDNWKVMQENETISNKIKQLDTKIKLYQADILKADSDSAANRQLKYQQKSQKKDVLQRNKDRQRRHFQLVYFQIMKDLQYEMNGCEAITNKIIELQERIKDGKAEIAILKSELVPLVAKSS